MSLPHAPQVLKEFKEVLGDKMILAYGTVLFLHRNKELHQAPDDDEDTFVLAEDLTEELISELEEIGFNIYNRYIYKDKLMEISFTKDDVKIDIYVAHKRGDERYWAMYDGKWYPHHLPAYLLEKPEKYEWNGESWLVPSPIEKYLELTYGDWKTPVKEFDWRVDHKSYDPDYDLN